MKFVYDDKKRPYTGRELAPLRNYLEYGLMGTSIVAWVGPCKVEFSEMVDGEDVRAGSTIAADKMLHFVMELFDVQLATGVLVQRLFAGIMIDTLKNTTDGSNFSRRGDDVFYNDKKLNISIATRSLNSILVHVGVNITNAGTPVPTAALSDFNMEPKPFAEKMMKLMSAEWTDILEATYKVRGVIS